MGIFKFDSHTERAVFKLVQLGRVMVRNSSFGENNGGNAASKRSITFLKARKDAILLSLFNRYIHRSEEKARHKKVGQFLFTHKAAICFLQKCSWP
jgi:hypothetical protein